MTEILAEAPPAPARPVTVARGYRFELVKLLSQWRVRVLLLACQIGPIIRAHWAVENSLHWVMDMIFRDDECRIRTDHAPANFTTIKHMALNLIRRAPGKDSLRLERKVATSDDDFLASLVTA